MLNKYFWPKHHISPGSYAPPLRIRRVCRLPGGADEEYERPEWRQNFCRRNGHFLGADTQQAHDMRMRTRLSIILAMAQASTRYFPCRDTFIKSLKFLAYFRHSARRR